MQTLTELFTPDLRRLSSILNIKSIYVDHNYISYDNCSTFGEKIGLSTKISVEYLGFIIAFSSNLITTVRTTEYIDTIIPVQEYGTNLYYQIHRLWYILQRTYNTIYYLNIIDDFRLYEPLIKMYLLNKITYYGGEPEALFLKDQPDILNKIKDTFPKLSHLIDYVAFKRCDFTYNTNSKLYKPNISKDVIIIHTLESVITYKNQHELIPEFPPLIDIKGSITFPEN